MTLEAPHFPAHPEDPHLKEAREKKVSDAALRVGIDAAIQASEIVLRYWPGMDNAKFDSRAVLSIIEKQEGIGNFATIADEMSEKAIVERIQSEPLLRDHRFLGEEFGGIETNSIWQWIIDPIDGTFPFRNGQPTFGVSLGLMKNGEPHIGIIALPAKGQLVVARVGEGARLMDLDGRTKIGNLRDRKSTWNKLSNTGVIYDLGYVERGRQLREITAKLADRVGYPLCYSSASYSNALVANGEMGAYFCQMLKRHDVAAAAPIIQEVGGVYTNMEGGPVDWTAETITYLGARTPELHAELLEIINS